MSGYCMKNPRKELKEYKFYIFDLDGTMVDTCPDIVATVQYLIEKYNFEPKSNEFIRSCIGGGARNVLLKCIGAEYEEIIDRELLPLFVEYYTNHCSDYSKVYPDVINVLDHLKEKKKALSVATFKIRSATLKIFEDFDMMKYFDIIVTADDVENPKPAPDCINAILEHYHCKPDEALLIGDTRTDFMTGRNAGVGVCAVTYGYNSPEVMKSLQPDYLVDSMDELLKML